MNARHDAGGRHRNVICLGGPCHGLLTHIDQDIGVLAIPRRHPDEPERLAGYRITPGALLRPARTVHRPALGRPTGVGLLSRALIGLSRMDSTVPRAERRTGDGRPGVHAGREPAHPSARVHRLAAPRPGSVLRVGR